MGASAALPWISTVPIRIAPASFALSSLYRNRRARARRKMRGSEPSPPPLTHYLTNSRFLVNTASSSGLSMT